MLCKALMSFICSVSMRTGEQKDLDNDLAEKLIKGGFVVAVENDKPAKANTNKARAKRGG